MTSVEETAKSNVPEESEALTTRRSFLKKAAAGGAIVGAMYVAPQFSTVTASPAYATTGLEKGPFVLYAAGHTGDGISKVWTINPTDGQATLVATLALRFSNSMAVRPTDCKIFIQDVNTLLIYVIDPCTGTATLIGDPGRTFFCTAFSPAGQLYGITQSSTPELYTINDTNASIALVSALVFPTGVTAFPVSGLDFRGDGVLFGAERQGTVSSITSPERLVIIDKTTANVSIVGTISPDFGAIGSIAFDQDGQLFGSSFVFVPPVVARIAKINDSNAAVTDIQVLSPTTSVGLGIGFAPQC